MAGYLMPRRVDGPDELPVVVDAVPAGRAIEELEVAIAIKPPHPSASRCAHQFWPFSKNVAFIPAAFSKLRMVCVFESVPTYGPSSKVMATVPGTVH